MGDNSSTKLSLRWPLIVGVALVVTVGGTLLARDRGYSASRTSIAADEIFTTVRVTTAPTTTLAKPTTTTTATIAASTTTLRMEAVEAYGVPDTPQPTRPPPEPSLDTGFNGRGLVTIADGGAPLRRVLRDAPFVVAREGLVFPAVGYSLDRQHIWVFTSCDAYAWVPADSVLAQPPANEEGQELTSFADATIVLDPGHGGPFNIGAVGRESLQEKDVNLLIVERVRDLLAGSRSVDWETGLISLGGDIPAAGWVVVTRVGSGEAADYEAGLKYRSALANAINADAMVSIHNNAGIQTKLDESGSDVYYQSQVADSRRFAEILVEEFERSFAPFSADWVGDRNHGAVSRISARDGSSQYYGVLRRTNIPTVIAEGAYISNPSEAQLLETPAFLQAYADAVYRALVRFLMTDDSPKVSSSDPVTWRGVAGSGDARSECVIPAQP